MAPLKFKALHRNLIFAIETIFKYHKWPPQISVASLASACGEVSHIYREYFVSFSMHCTVLLYLYKILRDVMFAVLLITCNLQKFSA